MNIQWKRYFSRPVIWILVIMAMAVWMVGFTVRPRTMTIIADGKYHQVSTAARSVQGILSQAHVFLGPKDRVELSHSNMKDGTIIKVKRAVPIKIRLGMQEKEVWTAADYIGQAVAENGYPARLYTTLVDPGTKVISGMVIGVAPYKKTKIIAQERVPYRVEVRPDDKMLVGESAVDAMGKNGKRKVVYDVISVDGTELRRIEVASEILQAPVSEVKRVGTRATIETSRGTVRFTKKISMEATAYHPMDGDGRGITYSGIPAKHGVVAVDPNVIPIGTRLYVAGYGEAVAADTGGAIIGNRIDLCMDTYSECYDFGRRQVDVYVLP